MMDDWRTIRHHGRPSIEPRVGTETESAFAAEARAKDEARQSAFTGEVERQVAALEERLDRLWETLSRAGRVDGATYKRLDSIRGGLRWLKRTHGHTDTTGVPGPDGTAA